MAEIKAIEPNPFLKFISDKLTGARDFANKAEIPAGIQFGIPGLVYSKLKGKENYKPNLGDLLIGQSPEVIEDMAFGFKPYTGSGQTTRLDDRLIDVAGLPIPVAGIGAVVKQGGKSIQNKLGQEILEQTDPSRRDFLKQSGGVMGLAGLASVSPTLATKMMMMKSAAPDAARVGTSAAVSALSTPAKSVMANIIASSPKIKEAFKNYKAGKPNEPGSYRVEEVDGSYEIFLNKGRDTRPFILQGVDEEVLDAALKGGVDYDFSSIPRTDKHNIEALKKYFDDFGGPGEYSFEKQAVKEIEEAASLDSLMYDKDFNPVESSFINSLDEAISNGSGDGFRLHPLDVKQAALDILKQNNISGPAVDELKNITNTDLVNKIMEHRMRMISFYGDLADVDGDLNWVFQ